MKSKSKTSQMQQNGKSQRKNYQRKRTSSAKKIYQRNSLSKVRGSVSKSKKTIQTSAVPDELFAELERQKSNQSQPGMGRKISYAQRRASRQQSVSHSQRMTPFGLPPPPPPQLNDLHVDNDNAMMNGGLPRVLSPTEKIVSDVTNIAQMQ